ncbi:hypothetical protein D3C72_1402020 [compost metagenome]
MVEDRLHLGSAEAEGCGADRRRHGFQGSAGRDDDRRQGHQRQDETADQRSRARKAHEVDEDGEAEQTVNDRRNSREIVDIHLDKIRQTVLRGEFLEIDRGRDADRQ